VGGKEQGNDEWTRYLLDGQLKTSNVRDSHRHITQQYALLRPLDPTMVDRSVLGEASHADVAVI